MNKNEHIELICMKLQGLTKLSFQVNLGNVLKEFYTHKGLTYEMPSGSGGDDKNDGWVVEEEVFFQIYAPTQLRTSLPKDMRKKFEEDLEGLLTKLDEGKWNGNIRKFIFLVNTFDDNLPKDSDRFYEQTVERFKTESGFEFEYKVENLQFIKRLLREIDDLDVFSSMQSMLGVTMSNTGGIVTEQSMYHFLSNLGNDLMNASALPIYSGNYERISTQQKININDLSDIKEEINNIIDRLHIVETAVSNMNQSLDTAGLFESIIVHIISIYSILSRDFKGTDLFNRLCAEVHKISGDQLLIHMPTKFLIVYIFDRCDIFEKEEAINNVNTQ